MKLAKLSTFSTLTGLFLIGQSTAYSQMWVDFNSNQSSGGAPVVGDPSDPSNAAHHEPGYLCYHAAHENPDTFITASYEIEFALTGDTEVEMTPEWPNTTAASVRQSIGRSNGQAGSWLGNNQALVRDWIGADARTAQSGNGAWDGTNGTPTYFQLRFDGLPAATYEMTAFFHDVEHMNSDFTIEVSTDGGGSFEAPILGRMTNSLAGGTPAENEVLPGEEPNVAGGELVDLSSTQVFSFTTEGQELVLRFAALAKGSAVHGEFIGLNGFQLKQTEAAVGPGFAITRIVRDPATGNVELTWNSKPGATYAIRYSGDLSGEIANWPDLEESYASEGEETSYTDETNPEGRRFYVIEEL